ncbi:hypothetical protein [Microbacterium karelineae]|uniref:hypothetical protein n=1 Tax=Microbacterium karelineae TaxID=2654283 RepID=UPI0012E99B8B|nr:hypothetical protein [Microbacterium karelineae]
MDLGTWLYTRQIQYGKDVKGREFIDTIGQLNTLVLDQQLVIRALIARVEHLERRAGMDPVDYVIDDESGWLLDAIPNSTEDI